MRRLLLLLLILFALSITVSAQHTFVKAWDYRFGGEVDDELTCFKQTSDGGFILGGESRSRVSGDKSEPNRDTTTSLVYRTRDYWIVKIDSNGQKQWDKTYGGKGNDNLRSLCHTADGGFLLGGFSDSDAEDDKTDTLKGISDYWIVKIDSVGNKQWDKDFGVQSPNYFSWLYSILQTIDGGYLLGGHSTGGGGAGDKSEPSYGGVDYWIIKIDAFGNKQWDKGFGGSNNENMRSLVQSPDGGFLIGGGSGSNASGTKTEPPFGSLDYWVVKIDSLGNEEWDKVFGGDGWDYLTVVRNTSDGGFLLGGMSESNTSGNKSQDTKDTTSSWKGDYWIVKIDSLGNKIWDKDYGSFEREYSWMIIEDSSDNGYIISGNSDSEMGGDKTENNLGESQIWVVKTDSSGNLIWDKTIPSPGDAGSGIIIQDDRCYYIACDTEGGIGGDKTQESRGSFDYWVLKFCDSTFLQASFIAPPDICTGACIDFTNFSINASTYQWNFAGGIPAYSTDTTPRICYSTPGSYDVTLIASNASGSDTITMHNYITVHPYLPQTIVQSGDTLFSNQGSSGYQWFHNGTIIIGATNYFHVLSDSGDYNVICMDTNGCEVEAVIFDVHISIDELTGKKALSIFPNPASDKFTLQIPERMTASAEINIFNTLGEIIYSIDHNTHEQLHVNCESFQPGIYMVKISDNENVLNEKVIILH